MLKLKLIIAQEKNNSIEKFEKMLLCDKVIFYNVFKAKILVNVAERKTNVEIEIHSFLSINGI